MQTLCRTEAYGTQWRAQAGRLRWSIAHPVERAPTTPCGQGYRGLSVLRRSCPNHPDASAGILRLLQFSPASTTARATCRGKTVRPTVVAVERGGGLDLPTNTASFFERDHDRSADADTRLFTLTQSMLFFRLKASGAVLPPTHDLSSAPPAIFNCRRRFSHRLTVVTARARGSIVWTKGSPAGFALALRSGVGCSEFRHAFFSYQ